MNDPLLLVITALVQAYLLRGKAPRDALVECEPAKPLTAAQCAVVVRRANHVIARRRLLEFAARCVANTGSAVQLVQTAQSLARSSQMREQLTLRLGGITDPIERCAVEHSLPNWLAEQFLASYGAEATAVLSALLAPAPRTLRANPLVVEDRLQLARTLAEVGITTTATAHAPWGLQVHGDADLFATQAYRSGAFEQQDEASQLAAWLVAPPPRGSVLDFCAGSGGKTLAIAAQLANRGRVLASDLSAVRLAALRTRLARARADNVQALQVSATTVPDQVVEFARAADRILVDSPCSGTGSWRRRPEARWQLAPDGLQRLLATQAELLARTAEWLQPGARLIYATCSLLPQENEQQVQRLLELRGDLELVRLAEIHGKAAMAPLVDASGHFMRLRPDLHGCDGFFLAVLRKRHPQRS